MATIKTSKSKATLVKKSVPVDLIRSRAYEIYLKRIRYDLQGDPDSDWFRAEKELIN